MIDNETIQKIKDAARIEDVVSDFVTLRRRGANLMGLCPFHNEKTPSFSVSPARNYCKCFSCGEGANPIGFMMKHEQMSYTEALRYLAKKYNIEVVETEMNDEEREAMTERESMLNCNEFAMKHFESNLWDTEDGQTIGLTYFRERGVGDEAIRRFHLGYSMLKGNKLVNALSEGGYNVEHAATLGLCGVSEHGDGQSKYDRFRGRVMYPIQNAAGRVVAFGGRTLGNDSAKYINSPESSIFKKSNELYGLYQAKRGIQKTNKCYLVEGYMDVISMHQSGFDNAVASSGTSLTEGQIKRIHRFTNNVTVIYDGDKAGIKASLRAIDMILDEGMNVKLLLLPDGHDPDSFCKQHPATYVEQYIAEHEQNFVKFKHLTLFKSDDPETRISVLKSIANSISFIQDKLTQSVYVQECAHMFGIAEDDVKAEIASCIADRKRRSANASDFTYTEEALKNAEKKTVKQYDPVIAEIGEDETLDAQFEDDKNDMRRRVPAERDLMYYAVKYGMVEFCIGEDATPMTVADYIRMEFANEGLIFSNPNYYQLFEYIVGPIQQKFFDDYNAKIPEWEAKRNAMFNEGIEEIRANAMELSVIEVKEAELTTKVTATINAEMRDFRITYIANHLSEVQEAELREIAQKFLQEQYKMSKIHAKMNVGLKSEVDMLDRQVPIAIDNVKYLVIDCEIERLNAEMTKLDARMQEIIQELQPLYAMRSRFAAVLGERVINPKS